MDPLVVSNVSSILCLFIIINIIFFFKIHYQVEKGIRNKE